MQINPPSALPKAPRTAIVTVGNFMWPWGRVFAKTGATP